MSSASPRTSSGCVPTDRLRVLTGDARGRLRDVADDSTDLVVGDAFGGRAVPYHLTTGSSPRTSRRVLRPDGIYVQNIIDQPPLRFLAADIATLRDVFAHVAVLGPPARFDRSGGGNTVVVASDAPLPVDELRRELAAAPPTTSSASTASSTISRTARSSSPTSTHRSTSSSAERRQAPCVPSPGSRSLRRSR